MLPKTIKRYIENKKQDINLITLLASGLSIVYIVYIFFIL